MDMHNGYMKDGMAAHTTLFLSNGSQAVRLPPRGGVRGRVREVTILRDGPRRIIVPADALWDDFFEAAGVDLGEREQPAVQQRDGFRCCATCWTPAFASA